VSASMRVGRDGLFALRQRLNERDREILEYVAALRLLGARQIQTLLFPEAAHANAMTAARCCRRVLERLTREGLLARLERRVGGVRSGSASYIYSLTSLGQRVLDVDGARRRLAEPSAFFVEHTLAVAEFLVRLVVAARAGRFVLSQWEAEPECWRDVGTLGGRLVLKPDLFVVLLAGEYELRWFVEIDRGTEHVPTLLRKCRLYHTYYKNGVEQREHEVFPRVLWVAIDQRRADRLGEAITADRRLTSEIFRVTPEAEATTTAEDPS
jgi:Replication-relaxation